MRKLQCLSKCFPSRPEPLHEECAANAGLGISKGGSEVCKACSKELLGQCVTAAGATFHKNCFKCSFCKGSFFQSTRYAQVNQLHCFQSSSTEASTIKGMGCMHAKVAKMLSHLRPLLDKPLLDKPLQRRLSPKFSLRSNQPLQARLRHNLWVQLIGKLMGQFQIFVEVRSLI